MVQRTKAGQIDSMPSDLEYFSSRPVSDSKKFKIFKTKLEGRFGVKTKHTHTLRVSEDSYKMTNKVWKKQSKNLQTKY